MKTSEAVDLLTYRSWWYQINWYGMEKEKARMLYDDWRRYEEIYENKKEDQGKAPTSPDR